MRSRCWTSTRVILLLALIDEGVENKAHFRLISQMRFYWEEDTVPWRNIPDNVRAVKEAGDGKLMGCRPQGVWIRIPLELIPARNHAAHG